MKSPRFFLLALSSLLAAGCGAVYKPGFVVRDWSCKLRELQIQPLFPPREDVQVGDVYLVAVPKDGGADAQCKSTLILGMRFGGGNDGFVPMSVHVASLDVSKEVDDYYAKRLDLPATTTGLTLQGDKIVASGYTTPSAATGILPLKKPDPTIQNLKRLRTVGFPDFMSVKVSGADIGAITPLLGMPAEVTFGADAVESASISVPVAESYGYPALDMLNRIRTNFSEPPSGSKCLVRYDDIKTLFSKETRDTHNIILMGIHEVFYTRAISLDVSLSQSSVLGINRDRSSTLNDPAPAPAPAPAPDPAAGAAPTPAPAPAPAAGAAPAPAGGTLKAEDKNAINVAQQIADAANALAKRNGLPGVTFQSHGGSKAGIGMTRVFEHPVAIGFHSVNYLIEGPDGDCLKIAGVKKESTNTPAEGAAR